MRKSNTLRGSNRLIVIEGIDGAGKATQTALLSKRLRAAGSHVTSFSIPRYDKPVGKLIKKALHGEYGNFRHLDPHLSAMPYIVDYAAAKEDFLKALKRGHVVFDRYMQSTYAYHGAKLSGKKRSEFIREMQHISDREIGLPKPDAIIYLDVPPRISRQLMRKKKKDQNEKDAKYQEQVARTYKMLSKGKNWHVIPCAPKGKLLSRAEIRDLIWKALKSTL